MSQVITATTSDTPDLKSGPVPISLATDGTPPFPSAESLRAAHNELLKQNRERLEQAGESTEVPPPEFISRVAQFIEQGRTTGKLIDSEEDRWTTQSLLDYWATVLFRAGQPPLDASLADFDPELLPELNNAVCPYLGLDAFQEINSGLFFGRRRPVEEMVEHLTEGRLLAVVGPSGSGKSSVVFAGLLPTLKNGAVSGSAGWTYYPSMVPGSDPIANLLLMLKPSEANPALWVKEHREQFLRQPDYLRELVETQKEAPALIIVDQFEEIFTLCYNDELAGAFVANLLHLIESVTHRHTVIITLRSDFEPRIARLDAFFARFQSARITVTPLGANALREAVERPAEMVGLKFEVGIVDTLVKEILGEPAGLPLLQFSLLSLWKRRQRNRITWEAYNKLGGPREALTLSADEFYNGLITQDQITAKRIFLRLARTSEGFEVYRNRVKRELLYKAGEARDQVDRVLDKLVAARLLHLTKGETPLDDQIEVAHEALVRNWRRLVEWIDQERASLQQRLRLTAAAERWRIHGKDPGGLLGGSLLEEARQHQDLSELETEFIQASQDAIDIAEREKQATEAQTLANARLRKFLVALLSLFIISLALAYRAYEQSKEANQQRVLADEQRTKADSAKVIADQQRAIAIVAQEMALNARDSKHKADALRVTAETERKKAVEAQSLAETRRIEADSARSEALRDRNLAIAAEAEARRERNLTKSALDTAIAAQRRFLAEQAEANRQRELAETAEREANEAKRNNVQFTIADNDVTQTLRKRIRPLHPGASVSSTQSTVGSISFFVKDRLGKRYLFSLGYVFKGDIGTPILQPAAYDKGSEISDKVAVIERKFRIPNKKEGVYAEVGDFDFVLARVNDDIKVESTLPTLGRIIGVTSEISPGDTVYLIGRGSGVVCGKIVTIRDRNGDIETGRLARPGDGGAPVLTKDGKLIGVLWGGTADKSLIIPIQVILDLIPGFELIL